jgi:hypothetical protein
MLKPPFLLSPMKAVQDLRRSLWTVGPNRLGAESAWLIAAGLSLLAGSASGASTNLNFKFELNLKETYDSNVYLQDNEPNPANVAAARAAGLRPVEANKGSFVTSILPKVGLNYLPTPEFGVNAAYAPDVNWYHSASSEDYVAHRGTLNLGGKVGDALWELSNTGTYIEGSDQGPTFARPDDIPALGGIPLRDRRAAFIFRNTFRVTEPLGEDWFVRPVAGSYIHDFKTEQRYIRPADRSLYSYENYIDRQEIYGGLDFGYKVAPGTYLTLGYRYGQQDQFKGPYGLGGSIVDSPFDSAYHRVLLGVEGSPVDWLKLNVAMGPDIRQFSDESFRRFIALAPSNASYAAFDRNELLYYLDASVTLIPGKADSLVLRSTWFEQPAFSSFSMYQDIKHDLIWRHRLTDQLSAALGFTLYIGDWQPPVNRDDWIYTPNASLTYAITSKLAAEVAYSYDWVESKIPASIEPLTESHEFTRHLASLSLKYAF